MSTEFLDLHNAEAAPLSRLPDVSSDEFRKAVFSAVESGDRLAALFVAPVGGPAASATVPSPEGAMAPRLIAVIARAGEGFLSLLSTHVEDRYASLTPECPQAHWFERDVWEQWGIVPEGHPWLKPLRVHAPGEAGSDFFQVKGSEIHEVAVGPVHAGVIEPGHFRFQCHGERVLHLEIALGYQHRGVERALREGPGPRTIHYMETLAGDTTIGHAVSYSQVCEGLAGTRPYARAEALRGIALELERLANHTGDLGALAGDVGFLPTASFCGRLRGDFLNMTALLCGNRMGRGFVLPGGVGFDVDGSLAAELDQRLAAAGRDVQEAADLLLTNQSVIARFEDAGTITEEICRDLGLVGPPARACGLERDVRSEFPSGIYQFSQVPVSTWHTGDVFARAHVRRVEVQRSLAFVREQMRALPQGSIWTALKPAWPAGEGATEHRSPAERLAPDHLVVSLVEGWRGEICHVALTDEAGRFLAYKVYDPSVHNWIGLAMALRDEEISDFPLCNKSFNLSYCGHDL